MRKNPVPLKVGNLICVNINAGKLWIEKEKPSPDFQMRAPTIPVAGDGKRHFPVTGVFTGMKDEGEWNKAWTIASAIAWAHGFRIEDDTALFMGTNQIYIFTVSEL